MSPTQARPLTGERGSSTTIELILLTPLALAVLFFLVIAGRVGTVTGEVAAASRDAARAASLAQTHAEATDAAQAAAAGSLADRNVTCDRLTVVLGDPASFVAGGEVAATVSCDVSLADVALPGVPATRTVTATSVEVIDQRRGIGR